MGDIFWDRRLAYRSHGCTWELLNISTSEMSGRIEEDVSGEQWASLSSPKLPYSKAFDSCQRATPLPYLSCLHSTHLSVEPALSLPFPRSIPPSISAMLSATVEWRNSVTAGLDHANSPKPVDRRYENSSCDGVSKSMSGGKGVRRLSVY